MHSRTAQWVSQVVLWQRICLPMQETQETRVQALGPEDPLEKETATHSSILAWKILWVEKPGGLQSMGSQRVRHDCNDLHQHQSSPAIATGLSDSPGWELRERSLCGSSNASWRVDTGD